MMDPMTDPELSPRELSELSALADGSLAPGRRDAVIARVEASPELTALYERERRAVALLRTTHTDRAPAALRERIERQRAGHRRARRVPIASRRIAYGGALAGALAAIVLALVLILPAGTPGAPSVSEAAALATRGAVAPAPVPDTSAPSVKLGQSVGSVYFPDWTSSFGWRATGQRSDHINGRLADTVYYRWHGKTLAYTIVAAPALASPSARTTRLNGTELRTLRLGGRLVVTWRRDNHTCVLSSSAGIPASVLQKLAAWTAPGAGHD
jgi:anti-sigma factor RsiW